MIGKRVLFVYPNTTDSPVIPGAIPILSGIAKAKGWDRAYFGTYSYENTRRSENRGQSGEFKTVQGQQSKSLKPFESIAQDLISAHL